MADVQTTDGGKGTRLISAETLFDYFQEIGAERDRFLQECGKLRVTASTEDIGVAKRFVSKLRKERGLEETDFPRCD